MAGENPQTTMPPVPREPLIGSNGRMSSQWERWIQQIQRILSFSGGIAWAIVNKAASKLSDIETRTHAMLQSVLGWVNDADIAQVRHISNANGKKWEDHVDITDGNPHGTDHHMLDGLADDDHSQYLLLAGRTGQRAVTPLVFGSETDNTTFEVDGTPLFNGAATNWNDINKSLLPLSTGANVPTIIAVNGATHIKVRAFNGIGTLNELGEGCEILHDYKEGTDIHPHLHWAATTSAVGNVKWQLAYMWVDRNGTFSGETVTSVTVATSGVAWQEQRTDFPVISGTGKHIGSRFQFVLFRDPSDVADTYGADAAAFDFGIHFERDTIGSRQITAK